MINFDPYFGRLPDPILLSVIKWADSRNIPFINRRFRKLHSQNKLEECIEIILRVPQSHEARKSVLNKTYEQQLRYLKSWLEDEKNKTILELCKGHTNADFECVFGKFNAILASGADPNCLGTFLEESRVQNQVIEEKRLFERLSKIIKVLLERGANPNRQYRISTPLLLVLYTTPRSLEHLEWMKETVKILCEKGADPHLCPERDVGGYRMTPIQYATKYFQALLPAIKK